MRGEKVIGKPCRICGGAVRYVNSHNCCVSCTNDTNERCNAIIHAKLKLQRRVKRAIKLAESW